MPKSRYWDRPASSQKRRRQADFENESFESNNASRGPRPTDVSSRNIETISTPHVSETLGQRATSQFIGLGIGEAEYGYARRRPDATSSPDPYEDYDPTEHGNAD